MTEPASLYSKLRGRARLEARELIYRLHLPVSYRLRMIACAGAIETIALLPRDRSYLYVPVPKAANMTIRQVLWGLADAPLKDEEVGQVYKGIGPFTNLASLRPSELREVLTGRGVFRFTFVRNPYARLLSAYRNKILTRPPDLYRYMANLRWPVGEAPSFGAFVQRVVSQRDIDKDPHWLPQHRATFMDFIRYDFIGKVENFNADFRVVLDRIAPSAKVEPGRLNASAEDELGYTEALAEMVYRAYRRDFDVFGYDPASYRSLMAP